MNKRKRGVINYFMALIYIITNDINDKVYVGKTELPTVEARFSQHLKDYKKIRCEKRPLYNAMRKYGPEHFHIELIEETEHPEEREMYWIKRYNSYKYGYNATLGGDGKAYIDRDAVVQAYKKLKSLVKVSKELDIHEDTVRSILVSRNIEVLPSSVVCANQFSMPVSMYTMNNEYITTFNSTSDAGRYVLGHKTLRSNLKTVSNHISEVCRQERRSAFGFRWRREMSPLIN